MAHVFEVSHDSDGLARSEAASLCVFKFQGGFASGDEGSAFPSVATANGGDIDGEACAIGNARGDIIAETIHGGGGFGSEAAEGTRGLSEGKSRVVAGQRDVGGASGGSGTDVLEGDAELGFLADVSIGG